MRLSIVVVVLLAVNVVANTATIYVPDDYSEIQQAIDASDSGDTVIVRPGTYIEDIDFKGKAITVRSERGAEVTTIDGGTGIYATVRFRNGEGPTTVIEGFTITNGDCVQGGGILCNESSPTITNNIIVGNKVSKQGGGICCTTRSSPIITNNIIGWNTSDIDGGGLWIEYKCSPTITDNTIIGNSASHEGGGIFETFSCSSTITNNTIVENLSVGYGGGINCSNSVAAITNNIISSNYSTQTGGGGIACYLGAPTIANNIISGNEALFGGGISCHSDNAIITNNIISNNQARSEGGGVKLYISSVIITNNTIVGNWAASNGGGIGALYSSPTITNTILWNNTAPLGKEIWAGDTSWPSTVTMSDSDVEGGQASCYISSGSILNWGAGMIDADPLFVNTANEDYHLTWPSLCCNAGNNNAVTELFDFENDSRIWNGTVDMGADEFHLHLYHVGSVVPGNPIEVIVVGLPNTSTVTLGIGSGIKNPPKITPYGDLWLKWPFLMRFSMPAVGGTGISILNEAIPTLWQSGEQYHFQALVGNELTNLMTLTVVAP